MIILAGIKPIEERLQGRHKIHEILVEVQQGSLSMTSLERALGYRARRIVRYVCEPDSAEGSDRISIGLIRLSPKEIVEIEGILKSLPGVAKVQRIGG
jgi:hypothetical protein